MLSAMFTGVSGMNANGTALSVVSDNIANMNTTGFKSSRASFGDVLSQSIGGSQIGGGVNLSSVSQSFSQGSFESSTSVLDMAIDGKGFFMLDSSAGTRYYSRAGEFHTDSNGIIVTNDGHALQAYALDPLTNLVVGSPDDVNIGSLNNAPNSTDNVAISVNLDATEAAPAAFDVTDPSGTSNFSTSITVYDSLGSSHGINIYFRKEAANDWDWHAVVSAADNQAGIAEVQATGQLTFDASGTLTDDGLETYATGGFDFSGGATQNQTIDFDFLTNATTTQYGSSNGVSLQTQDGYGSGTLQSVTISSDGTITGVYTNGQSQGVARVALTTFPAETELTKAGGSLFTESYGSGSAVVSQPGTGSAGTILSNTLELSNVDLASEFVKMIMNQRGFQANSRIVSVSDDLLAELVNLTR